MKGMSKKLKKILIACVIVCLLSSHFAIIGELCNIAYATGKTSIFNQLSGKQENDDEQENEVDIHVKGENTIKPGKNENKVDENKSKNNKVSVNIVKDDEVVEKEDNIENQIENNEIKDKEDQDLPLKSEEHEDDEILGEDSKSEDLKNEDSENSSIMDELLGDDEDKEIETNNSFIKNDMILEENDKRLEIDKVIKNEFSEENYKIGDIDFKTNLSVDRLIKFDNESGKGVFVETTFKLEFDKMHKKITNMNISLNTPKINELVPLHINILNASVWEYDEENEKINIPVEDIEMFANNVCLEYKILFVFSEEAYNVEKIEVNGIVSISNTGDYVEKEFSNEVTEIVETTESFVQYKSESENASIYKGYLKANVIAERKNETIYDVVKKVDIKNSDFVDEIELEDNGDKIIQEDGTEVDFEGTYKRTTISVDNFEKILEEEGYIEIYTKDGSYIGSISKQSKIENNNYVFEYEQKVEDIRVKIVNPVNNGEIVLKNQKAVKETNEFTKEQVDEFKKLKTNITGKLIKEVNGQKIVLQSVIFSNEISLENTESKMKIDLSSQDLSTEIENELTLNVTLETDEERYELFKNPTIDIEFPYSVEEVKINNINLLYKNGLSLDSWNVITNTAGEKVIRVKLDGTQLDYMCGNLIKGTQLIIYSTIKVNRLTANGTADLKLRYTNEASESISYQVNGKEYEEVKINYVSKSGLIKATSLENYNSKYDKVTNFNNESNLVSLDVFSESRVSRMSMTVLNNHSTEISDVVIVGRIPTVGNKDEDGNDLYTTIDTYLNREISTSGIMSKIYYSLDINAQKDDDSWLEKVDDITKVKSYKIVIENETMKKGEKISFDYDIVIPEDLDFNEKMFGIFSVYYNLNGEDIVEESVIGAITEEKELVLEDCQTSETIPEVLLGIGTQVTLAGKAIDEKTEVHKGQILRYNVILTNNGNEPIQNVKLKATVENGNMYWFRNYEIIGSSTLEKEITGEWTEDINGEHLAEEFIIDKLEIGETKTVSYQVVAKKDGEYVFGKIEVSADNIESKIVETIKNKVIDAKLKLSVTSGILEDVDDMKLTTNSPFKIVAKAKNISEEVLENICVNLELPKYIEVNEVLTELFYQREITVHPDRKGCIVENNINKLEVGEEIELWFYVTIKEIDYSQETQRVSVVVTSQIGEEKYFSNDYMRDIYQTETIFSAKYTSNRENGSVVKNGDSIVYNLDIKNEGVISKNIQIIDRLPYGVDIKEINLIKNDSSKENIDFENNYMSKWIELTPKESVKIEIIGNVDITDCRTDQIYISNIFETEEKLTEDSILEEIIFKIEYPEDYFKDPDSIGDNDIPLENDKDENQKEDEEDKKEDFPKEDIEDDKEEDFPKDEVGDDKVEDSSKENVENDKIEDSLNKEENRIEDFSNVTNNEIIQNNNIQKENTYSISGFVWYDADKDGLFHKEEKADKITVYLFKADQSKFEKYNLVKTTTTNEDGEYSFTDLVENKYVVVFSYDNNLYKTTKYLTSKGLLANKSYANENLLKINDEEKKYGLSDIIILNENVSNINLGLIKLNEFDMSIKTYLSSLTIVNKKENTTQKFKENSDLNKIEIASKYIDGTKITAEYKIRITNTGNISGYINQIVDIIPEGFDFNKNLNKNWSLGDDGKLYNSSLSNIEIKPGESKELNLILNKTLTGETTGTFINQAKILEITNNLQLEDINKEDNTSKTELIIAIKTGITTYISISFIIISIIVIAFFITNKKIIKNRRFVIILIGISVLGIFSTISLATSLNGIWWNKLSTIGIDTYLDGSLTLGSRFGPTSNGAELEANHKIQCIHSSDISYSSMGDGNIKARRFYADVKIGFDENNPIKTSYSYVSGGNLSDELLNGNIVNEVNNLTTTDGTNNSSKSQMIAYLAYLIEKGDSSIGRSHLSTVVVRKNIDAWSTWTGASIPESYNGLSNIGADITNIETALDNINTFYDNNKDRLVVAKQTSTPSYNGTYLGPFKATFPIGDKCSNTNKVYVDGVDYSNKIYTSTTASSPTDINSLNNTNFYIKYDSSNISDTEVSIKLENSHKYYKARILPAGNVGLGQFESVTRGKECTSTTNCTWTVELGCDVSVTKQTIKVGSTTVVAANDAEKTYEIGDEVRFKITVTNSSGRRINMKLTDSFDTSAYEYVSVSDWSWTKESNGTYTRIVNVDNGTVDFYIKLKLKNNLTYNTDNKYINTVTISDFKNKSEDTATLTNKTNNAVTAQAYAKCKKYKATINKYITDITDQTISDRSSSKATSLSADSGDYVTFCIKIENTGSTGTHGTLYNIEINDTWTNSKYISDITYAKRDPYNGNQIGDYYVESEFNGYTEVWDVSGSTIKYINSAGLAPGAYDKIYIKCKVSSDKENKLVRNTAQITSIKNRNNVEINTTDKMENITATSSDEFLTRIYALDVKKEVLSIKGRNNVTISNKNNVEIGDVVTYRITVTNSASNEYYGGKIYKFNLKDYFEAENFGSITIEGTNWRTEHFDFVDGIQTFYFKYENSAGLAPGESTYVDIRVSVDQIKEQISNKAEIILSEDVINKNDEDISDILTGTLSDTETIGVLGYKVRLKKYVLNANGKRQYGRVDSSNEWKNNNPVLVQNGNTITYTIELENIGETNIKGITISDIIDSGLEFASGDGYTNITITKTLTTGVRQSLTVSASTVGKSKTISLPTATFLDAGETLRINVTVNVTASDFHLLNLKNIAEIASLRNRNNIDIKDLVEYDGENNEDYVRLNDPIVEGRVWLDEDEDGFIDRGAISEEKLEGITVKLYDATHLKVATTVTDSEGKYKFSATNGTSLITGQESSVPMVLSDGRIVKGTNRNQTTGNYNSNSELINYYIEFEYNGVKYRPTKYGNRNYIADTRNLQDRYKQTSKATEFEDVRKQFNEKLETISNNKGQSESKDLEVDLSYEKTGHESKLKTESGKTTMVAQTFINRTSSGLDGISRDDVKYLLFENYKTNEYLKYINLGLVSNEVDLKLEQDLYKIKTTINGEEMLYVYNQGHLEDSEYAGEYVTGGEENPKKYEFIIYNSDYYYNPETYYNSEAVKEYKQNTELDVEVTYRIKISNENVGKEDDGTYAIIKEIVNYYDENFVEYGEFTGNVKQIKIADREGNLQLRKTPTIYAQDVVNPLGISENPKYGEKQILNGYNNLYIEFLVEKKLEKGEYYNLYVTYTVSKTAEEIDGFTNRLILGEKASISEINAYSIYNADGTPAGLVDKNSNPGNMVNEGNISEYEDDTYKTVLNISRNTDGDNEPFKAERKESGIVWNDSRSEGVEGQYAGNGINIHTIELDEEEKDELKDEKEAEAKSNDRIDETHDTPVKDAKIEMIEQVAIKQTDGSVRIYEESVKPWNDSMMKTRTNENGEYTISGFIPGRYVTRFSYGDTDTTSMVIYNGQDYKSTTYAEYVEEFRRFVSEEIINSENNDDIITKLEIAGFSDARDDEIQRLKVNSYAEVMNTEKMEILNQTAGNNADLINNSKMYAETVVYKVKPEKVSGSNSLAFGDFYENMLSGARYGLNNIDFGLEYRPEVNMNLEKYISNVKVILSNGTELFNLKYDNVYEDNVIVGTTLSGSSSIGADKFQFIPRKDNDKGLGILNTDIDLLQGATVEVEYLFAVENQSEVDRIGEKLYNLRYKGNSGNEAYEGYFEEIYTATGTAKNQLCDEYYNTDEKGVEYKTKEKKEDYYGKYLGEMYYKGTVGTDKIAEIKVDKILDYVDTDFTFDSAANSGENKLWKTVTSKELYDGGYITKEKLDGRYQDGIKFEKLYQNAVPVGGFLVNEKGVQYNTETQTNLAISVDDRIKDNDDEEEYDDDDVINNALSKFLKPKVVSGSESSGWIKISGSTVIASDEQTADMTYDNTGEIVQYTTQSGRTTRLASAFRGSTESILIVPPTGAFTIMYYVQKHIVKIIIAILVIVLIVVGINLKKNIIKLKKTYK